MKKLQESDLFELRINQKLPLKKIAALLGTDEPDVCVQIRKYPWYVPRASYKRVELTDMQCERIFGYDKRCTRKIAKGFRKLCPVCWHEAEGE